GFSLFLRQDGSVFLTVTGGTAQTVRFFAAAPGGNLDPNQWYHVAVVGNGPGNPVTFYITPVGSSNVVTYTSTGVLTGDNGTYTTDSSHELYIGQRSNKSTGGSPFNGGLVNEAIFDQALTPAQIQQLFVFGKSFADNPTPWKNPTEPMDIDGNGRVSATDALLLISRLLNNQGGALADPTPGNMPPPYLDPNGDGRLSAQDALGVISWLLTHHAAQSQSATSAAQVASADEPAASALASDNTIASNPSAEPAAISFDVESQDAPSVDLAVRTTMTETTEQPASAAPESPRVLMVQPRYVAATSQVNANDAALSDSNLLGCEQDGMPVDDALARTLAIRRRTRARATA
ncbi:MAG TPA: dockerin type I domain-containing protein, partial [Pirellulales bacterium]|nr:dockerin type I domain-containing protein [Pirellulales bacterium]